MKSLLTALLFAFTIGSLSAADAPALKAVEAATIAQADLASRGLEATVYLTALNYKDSKFLGEPAHWEVLWSKEVEAQTEGRKEIGLKIKMDGSYSRSVR